jgi:hypothetical protein
MAAHEDPRAVTKLRGGRYFDGDIIELDFVTLDGATLSLQFHREALEDINSQIVETLENHRKQTPHTHDHEAVRARQCANLTVGAAAGGDAILLSITDAGGTVHRFALSVPQAEQLRPALRNVEQAANRQRNAAKH